MRELSKREKMLIILMGLMLIIFVYYRFLLAPVLDGIKQKQAEIRSYNDEVKQITLTAATNKVKRKKLQILKDEYNNVISVEMPKTEREPEIIYHVKQLTDANKITLQNISVGEGASATNEGRAGAENKNSSDPFFKDSSGMISSVPVNITITCPDYATAKKMLDSVEKDKRLAQVVTFSLSPMQDKNKNEMTMSLSFLYFYMKENVQEKQKYQFNNGIYGKDNLFN